MARPGSGRRAGAAVGGRHGQARRARTQCVQRHRPDLRLRPGRRDRRQRRTAAAASPTTSTSAGGRAIYNLVGDTTEHGFVFRVDLALRPNGNSGPARCRWARWKSISRCRAANGSALPGSRAGWSRRTGCMPRGSAHALRAVVLPFVFRRYLDYNVFDSLRMLHRQIRDHAAKRSAGHPGARQRRQAVARRHSRDRVHRAAAAGGARRPVPRAAHAAHAGRVAARAAPA